MSEESIKISASGIDLYCFTKRDRVSLKLRALGEYHPELMLAMRRLLRPGDRFVDIGAHIGFFSLFAASLVEPCGDVIAFEPSSENIALFLKSIKESSFSSIHAFRLGISDRRGIDFLRLNPLNRGDHRFHLNEQEQDLASEEVEMISLDDFFHEVFNNKPIRMIKSDTQGAEISVLRGAQSIIEEYSPILILEYYPRGMKALNQDPRDFFLLLQKARYNKIIDLANGEQMNGASARAYRNECYTNLLCMRED